MTTESSGAISPVCLHCRGLRLTTDTREAVAPQAWCRLWQIVIPEPAATGCTEFAPRAAAAVTGEGFCSS